MIPAVFHIRSERTGVLFISRFGTRQMKTTQFFLINCRSPTLVDSCICSRLEPGSERAPVTTADVLGHF